MDKEYWDKVWSFQRPYLNKNKELVPILPWDINTQDSHLDFILSITNPDSVLELGCGSGNDAIYMAQKNIDVTAIDIADQAIIMAKKKNNSESVNFLCEDFLKFHNHAKFNMVYDRGFIHTQKKIVLESIFSKVYDLCSDNGYYVVICGNYNDDNSFETGTKPSIMTIGSIEQASAPFFKIKSVQEITIELNENFLPGVGWLVILQKRHVVNKSIFGKMQGNIMY